MTTEARVYRKDGTLSAYGFACGYVQTADGKKYTDYGATFMYREHNAFHVCRRAFTHERAKFGGNCAVWETFDTLTEARARYAELVKYPSGYNGYNSWEDWNVCLYIGDNVHEYNEIREKYAEAEQTYIRKGYTAAEVRRKAVASVANFLYTRRYFRSRTPDGAPYTEKRLRQAVEGLTA